MNQNNVVELPVAEVAPYEKTTIAQMMMDDRVFEKMVKYAEMMASGTVTTPKHLQGKPGDCFAVVSQAMLWGMHPHAVAQKTHLVNGQLGYEAQLVIAVLQESGSIIGSPHYEWRGEGEAMECRAGCIQPGKREVTWGEWLMLKSVTTRNSPLWKTNPKQQIGYLQAKNWARLYAPGAILGVYTPDELEALPPRDMGSAEVVGEPSAPTNTRTAALKEHMGVGKGKEAHANTITVPTLDEVVAAIQRANTPEDMAGAAKLCEQLADSDKKTARREYKDRLEFLKEQQASTQPPAVDPDDEFLKGLEQGATA